MKVTLSGYIVDNDFGSWLDEYGEDNITPRKVANAVAEANDLGETLEVSFSSMGGSVASAGEICASLQQVEHGTVGILSGLIASAGSTIACSFGTAKMYDYSEFMIHNPRINAWGMTIRPQEAKEIADMLETSTQSLVNIYCQKTGLDETEIRGYLDAEKFFTANEAKELGFVDEIIPIVSNSVGAMPKISYQDMVANANDRFAELTNKYQGAKMPNENKLVEENVVEEATVETTEETAVVEEATNEEEEECGEDCACHKENAEATNEVSLSDVLSAISALTESVSALVANSAKSAVEEVAEEEEECGEDCECHKEKATSAVEDVFHVDKAGKEKPAVATERKHNAFGLDITNRVI